MGIILNGILGAVSGKVAGVVGAKWKDKAYLRAFVKPANPNTAAQQVQRTKFSDVVNFAKSLVGQVFNAYTDKFQKSMSGFNFFIKRNIDIFDGTPDYTVIKVTEGPLKTPTATLAVLAANTVTITFSTGLGNNGLADDDIFAAVYNKDNGLWAFPDAEVNRSTGTIDIDVESGSSATDLQTYVWAAQSVGGILDIISNSSFKIGSV